MCRLSVYLLLCHSGMIINPFPNDKFSKLIDFADNNFLFEENGRKFSNG